jgi:putative transcriptional regulator
MSDETIIRYRPGRDPKPADRTDWKRVKALSDAEVEAAALADPDNLPLTEEELATARRVSPNVRALRSHLGMTQEQFAKAYHLPIGTVRDWEQGRSRPDAPAQALLKVIEREPEAARRALGVA